MPNPRARARRDYDHIALAVLFALYGTYSLVYPTQSVIHATIGPIITYMLFSELVIGSAMVIIGILLRMHLLQIAGLTITCLSFLTLFVTGIAVDISTNEDFKNMLLAVMSAISIRAARMRWLKNARASETSTQLVEEITQELPVTSRQVDHQLGRHRDE